MDGFHVLARVLPADYKHVMLGRVIVDKDFPLREFAPDENFLQPTTILPSISSVPVRYGTLAEAFSTTQCNNIGVGMTDLLRAYWGRDDSRHKQLTAGPAAHFTMGQVERKLNQLMENDDYRREVVQLLESQDNRSLPMVTGVFTCNNLQIHLESGASKTAGGKAVIPVGEATGTSPAVNPEIEIEHTLSAEGESIVTIEEEVIVALEYTYLRMKYHHSRPFPYVRKVRVGTPIISVAKQISPPRFAVFYAKQDGDDVLEGQFEASVEVDALREGAVDRST